MIDGRWLEAVAKSNGLKFVRIQQYIIYLNKPLSQGLLEGEICPMNM